MSPTSSIVLAIGLVLLGAAVVALAVRRHRGGRHRAPEPTAAVLAARTGVGAVAVGSMASSALVLVGHGASTGTTVQAAERAPGSTVDVTSRLSSGGAQGGGAQSGGDQGGGDQGANGAFGASDATNLPFVPAQRSRADHAGGGYVVVPPPPAPRHRTSEHRTSEHRTSERPARHESIRREQVHPESARHHAARHRAVERDDPCQDVGDPGDED